MNTTSATCEYSLLSKILPHLQLVRGPDARGEYVCWCPFHSDGQGKAPHQANLYVSERGYYCHACGAKGSLKQLAERLGVSDGKGNHRPEATYDYRDEQGNLLFQVCRYPGKKFLQRQPDKSGGWIWNLKGVRRVLYRLTELLSSPDATVYIVEGEKDADRLASEGMAATTNSGGAGKWRKEYAEPLQDRNVVLFRDNDRSGEKHVQGVAHSLNEVARSIKIPELPGLPEKGDVSDWLAMGHTIQDLKALVENTQFWQPIAAHEEQKSPEGADSGKQKSQADRMVSLILSDGIELFHDDLGDAFAHVQIRDHREIWRCGSKNFKQWMAQLFWHSEEKAPSSDAIRSALNIIEAKARFDAECHQLHNRVALYENAIWYDLANETWRAVRICKDGWEIVNEPPILFRRYSHQRPQPIPVHGGDLRELLHFINLRDPSQKLLLLVYIVCCFVPDIPHPIPVLYGPQGAAKTTLFRMLRSLIDPSATAVLSFPRDAAELVQQLSHHWAPFYDNISTLPDGTSDLLCRAVTGEGFSKRELYSDDDDIIYHFRRCIGLNGVNVAAHKADLLDRCILFGLETIAPTDRRPEKEMWQEFEAARPSLLGTILDVLARAMALHDSVRLSWLPRMADFALWGSAVAMALGHSADEFMKAYDRNGEMRNEEALYASPVAATIIELMEGQTEWEGTPSELLANLGKLAEEHGVNTRTGGWPKAAHTLSRRLNEVRQNLSAVGISVSTRRDGRHRVVIIRKMPLNSVTSVTTVTKLEEKRHHATLSDDAIAGYEKKPSLGSSLVALQPCASGSNNDGSDADDASFGPLQ